MATSSLIPVSEYLSTSYEPDCDYIEGELQERNFGERPNSLAASYPRRHVPRQLASLEHRCRHELYAFRSGQAATEYPMSA